MKAYKVTSEQMNAALAVINKKYAGNIEWKRFEPRGSGFLFTLRVKSSRNLGARLGQCLTSKGNRRHLVAACWHVHGDFFDALFALVPNSWIRSGGRKIDATQGNWEDRNIGSMMSPLMYSEACECH